LKKLTGSFRFWFYKLEIKKIKPNRNELKQKKPEKKTEPNQAKTEQNQKTKPKPSQTRKKPSQTEKTKPNRFEPVFVLKNQTKPN